MFSERGAPRCVGQRTLCEHSRLLAGQIESRSMCCSVVRAAAEAACEIGNSPKIRNRQVVKIRCASWLPINRELPALVFQLGHKGCSVTHRGVCHAHVFRDQGVKYSVTGHNGPTGAVPSLRRLVYCIFHNAFLYLKVCTRLRVLTPRNAIS